MSKKSFTLVEILVALIVLAIMASLAITTFQKTIQANEDRLCWQNLKIIRAALDIYTLENNNLPATLAKLEPRYIHLAYLKVVGEPKEGRFMAFFKNLLGIKPALAQFAVEPKLGRYYGYEKKVFICPAHTPPRPKPIDIIDSNCTPSGCGSYSFDSSSVNFDGTALIKTSTSALVYDNTTRHKKGTTNVANGITPGGTIGRCNAGGGPVTPD